MAQIYKITNIVNGKIYIGKTSYETIEERFKEHLKDYKRECEEKRPLYDAMKKYGIENFIIEKIEDAKDDKDACNKEIYWIDKLRTYIGFTDCNGYNATLGGDGKRIYNYKEISNKYLELQNLQNTADFFKCDRQTVRNACKENNIEILSGSQQAKKIFGKKVAQLDKNTLEIISIYDTIGDAFKALNKPKNGGIAKACNKGNICQGYRWKYLE